MKPNELTEKEIKKLQKKFPQIKKIPKKRLTKKEKMENTFYTLVLISQLILLAIFIYVLYLMLTYKW